MRTLIKRNAHQQRKETLKKQLLMQVLAVSIEDHDSRAISELQQDNELIKLEQWAKA